MADMRQAPTQQTILQPLQVQLQEQPASEPEQKAHQGPWGGRRPFPALISGAVGRIGQLLQQVGYLRQAEAKQAQA